MFFTIDYVRCKCFICHKIYHICHNKKCLFPSFVKRICKSLCHINNLLVNELKQFRFNNSLAIALSTLEKTICLVWINVLHSFE